MEIATFAGLIKFMNLFAKVINFFKPEPAAPDLMHPFFGALHAEVAGDANDFWQGEIFFAPLSIDITINIIAGQEGPSIAQVRFYQEFEKNWKKHIDSVESVIFKEYESWFNETLEGDFFSNFEFSSMTIPMGGNPENGWELSFECLTKKGFTFNARLDGSTVSISADS